MNRTHQDESRRIKINRTLQDESRRIWLATRGRFGGRLWPKRAETRTNPREFAPDPRTHWPVLSPLIEPGITLSEDLQELGQPLRVRRPRRGRNQLAVHVGLVHGHVHPLTAGPL